MLRKLALSLAVSAALGASQVNALGLGEIEVRSALNEPLDAEIRLTQVRDLSPLQIQPRMASLDEYLTAGGPQARYLRDIRFQVLLTADGEGRIRLKSTEPIQEPFLNFMVEVNWPSGRLVREYTLLLDPPVFEPAPVVRAAASTAPGTVTAAPAPAPRAPQPVSNIRTRMDAQTQVYVSINDTLWEIAKKVKPAGISEQQMMLALLAKNPQAFPSGNINNLRAGMVLDIPSAAEAQRLSHREAVAEVARQMQLWRDGRSSATRRAPLDVSKAPSVPATPPGTAAPATGDEAADEAKLSIVAPADEAEPAAEVSSATSSVDSDTGSEAAAEPAAEMVVSAAAERLENDVLMAQEKIDRLERENADLNDKLNSVLEQLESQNRLLELQSQQMATLQAEISQREVQPAVPAAAEPARGLAAWLNNPAVLGGVGAGAIALLAGLLLLLRRKRSGTDAKRELVNVPEDLRSDDRDAVPAAPAAATVAATAAGGAAAVAAAEAGEPGGEGDFVRPPMEALAPAEEELDVADLEQDLQELDLDMDLDLDDLDQNADAPGIDAAEFDLGLDEDATTEPADATEALAEERREETAEAVEPEFETALPPLAEEEPSSELDAMLGDQPVDEELDFLLADSVTDETQAQPAAEAETEADEGLEFALADDAPSAEGHESATEAADEAATSEPVSEPVSELDNSLHETVEAVDELEFEVDPDLEAMLQSHAEAAAEEDDGLEFELGFADDEQPSATTADEDLDSLLDDFAPADDSEPSALMDSESVEEELTANISHDLETDLDAEVDELLASTDDEIELDEQRNDEPEEMLDRLNLLSDADEIETKLDLARAYIEMEDADGARDILNEITSEGSEEQRKEAQRLLESLD